jgi:lysophospholipid acyltransferase (LPLAT)-like uncharacterized protein
MVLGKAIAIIVRLLRLTFKIEIIKPENFDFNTSYIYAAWHGQLFIPIMLLPKLLNIPLGGIVSTSKDGDIMAACMASLDYRIVRGSSSKQSIKALLTMVNMVKQGFSVGFAIDGPKGPRGIVKPGIIFLAQKTGRQIVPVSYKIKKKYILIKSWDKFEIPLPWQKIVFQLGEPIAVPAELTKEQVFELTESLAEKMGRGC